MNYRLHKPIPTRHHTKLAILVLLVGLLCNPVALATALVAESEPKTPTVKEETVIINEVKSGGSNTTPNEYVTVHNQSDQPITLDSWVIEYAKVTFPAANCADSDWKAASSSSTTNAILSGVLPAGETSNPFVLAINNDAAGAVHLVDASHAVIDLVGWGSDSSQAPCKEQFQAPMLNSSKSLIRYLDCDSVKPIDSDNNANDFMIISPPLSGKLASTPQPACTPPATAEPSNQSSSCPGLSISELMPNPAGTDTGHEYIELYNTSSEALDLSGCSLQTSANSKLFTLTSITLQPGQYLAVSDSQSGLSLSNTSGGTVWILDATNELQTVTYPTSMEDDTVWTYVDGQWGVSYTATPGAANILLAAKPCPEGQVRNTETNRCVNAETAATASAQAACAAGQERNPETNRCRNTATAASMQTACKEGQERNPETNRCRNIATATADKACPAGQERNSETNRCRKIAAAGSGQNGSGIDSVRDIASSSLEKSKPYWLIAGGILLAAIGYAVYEWRQEITSVCSKRLKVLGRLQAAR